MWSTAINFHLTTTVLLVSCVHVYGAIDNPYSHVISKRDLEDISNDILPGNDILSRVFRSISTDEKVCFRECDGQTKECYFKFHFERYSVLNPACGNCSSGVTEDCLRPQCVVADGFIKGVLTANRKIPGPLIQVCQGDTIIVDVENAMLDASTTVHWHGIRQFGTNFMDGVQMVTQCPIQPFTTFRYKFEAREEGTFFWHTHMGTQKLDGLTGPIIIRDGKKNKQLYDEDLSEHVIFIQDWLHNKANDLVPGLHVTDRPQFPDSVLINGRGPLSKKGQKSFVPLTVFTVERGKRYRFRLVSGTCMTCAVALKIDGHKLLAFSGDGGHYFGPTSVDSIGLNSGERFDFVLHANQSVGDYFIHAVALNDVCKGTRQLAILRYKGSEGSDVLTSSAPESGDLGLMLNFPNSTCDGTTNDICVSKLKGVENAPSVGESKGRYKLIKIPFSSYHFNLSELFKPGVYQKYEEPLYEVLKFSTMSNVSFRIPPSPLISQSRDIPPEYTCSKECLEGKRDFPCSCTTVTSIELGTVVDLLVYDNDFFESFNHAFHLHGYNFYVIEMGTLPDKNPERQKKLDEISSRAAKENIDLSSRPRKDSVTIPTTGYALVRFKADNPGYWMAHCHFLYHLETGMAEVFKIGRDFQIPRVPRNFPKCGNFV